MKVNKHLLQQNTELYRKKKHIWSPHVMLSTMVYNFFPFEGNLAEKQPYKH